ncbi:MAG TPA: CapA family protein [Mycobacteriales bacterium]|nr:CapA family protein [Mycobacteriales bacterium]
MDFTGDMLPSDALAARAHADAGGTGYDFRPMLRNVAPILRSADWAVCHQETPVSDDDVGLSGYPTFNAPYELAEAEHDAGYDACDTASNHTLDLGTGGIAATLKTLDRYHIQHTGSAVAPNTPPPIYNVHGVHIGHLAYTYGLNGISPPNPWCVNILDPARIRADAHALKARGADIVIVSMHMGIEKDQTPSDYERQMAAAVMQSPDVDLIVGAHAHVVQPVQRLSDGRWIIYGLGNFLAQQDIAPGESQTPPHRDGVIMQATFAQSAGKWRISKMGYVPTFVNAPSDVVEIAPAFSRARTEAVLKSMGAPLTDLTP